MIIGDYHTHTTYCDGVNTPEEMLKAAIEKGLKYYGFSSHSYLKYDDSWTIGKDKQEDYIKEILDLKEKYKDKITVLLGCEYDLLSENDLSKFDYVIGSCHSIIKDGHYLSVDHSEKTFVENVEKYYGGDYYAFVKDYYELLSTAADRKDITFIGHFDLISKYNLGYKYFDEDDERYDRPMCHAIDRLARSGKPFELNVKATFGISKDGMPSTAKWLDVLSELNGRIIINSDAHSTVRISADFEKAQEFASQNGFYSTLFLTENGFEENSFYSLDTEYHLL
ncbi:MAG: histidinol-phosphatase [Clostridia bacterium]|nr:histidinol-phosphatase [Clostridia bacterium]